MLDSFKRTLLVRIAGKLSKIFAREAGSPGALSASPASSPTRVSSREVYSLEERDPHEQLHREERQRIVLQNQMLLDRLQCMKPSIDAASFEERWRQMERHATHGTTRPSSRMTARSRVRPLTTSDRLHQQAVLSDAGTACARGSRTSQSAGRMGTYPELEGVGETQ